MRTFTATGAVLTAATTLALSACGSFPTGDGIIREVEEGRNGVKIEVQVGSDSENTEEVFLIKDTTCEVDDALKDCADTDDYLVPVTGAVPGLNSDDDDR